MQVFNDCDYESPDEAESAMASLIQPIIEDYVKKSVPKIYSPAPWWNWHYKQALKYKMKAFYTRTESPERYMTATLNAKVIQRKAFKAYNQRIKKNLEEMNN